MTTNLDAAVEAITDELQANAQQVTFTGDEGDEEEGFGFDVAEDTVAGWLAPRALDAADPRLKLLTPEDTTAILDYLTARMKILDGHAVYGMVAADKAFVAIPAHVWDVLS